MSAAPTFFQPADLLNFQQRLQTNHRYDSTLEADQVFARQLKASIFLKTAYWTQQVANRLPTGLYTEFTRMQWEQRHFLRRYSWGRFLLNGYPDKGFYITLGVDSGETPRARDYVARGVFPAGPSLIIKVDIQRNTQAPFPAPAPTLGQALLNTLPLITQWRRIGVEELPAYTWDRLIDESVSFITEHEDDLRRLWAVSGRPDPRFPKAARLGIGKTNSIREGKNAVAAPPRELEANDEHRRLSNILQALLPAYGYTEVERSCRIIYPGSNKSANEVDVKAIDSDGHITFFEIKALRSLDSCIREALGQLLEYAYWAAPLAPLANKLVIAAVHPLSEVGQHYIERIQKELNISLSYIQIDLTKNKLRFQVQ